MPETWIKSETTKTAAVERGPVGYGYQWWTYDGGSYAAQGIFGQGIFIDPSRQLVLATNSSWRSAMGLRDGENPGRQAFYETVRAAIDAEAS